MLSGDYDCTCAQRCTEEEHSADCLRCVFEGINGCTGEAVCICTTKCHDLDSGAGINPDCPACSKEGADLDAVCEGASLTLMERSSLLSVEAAWGLAQADGSAPESWTGSGTLTEAMTYANGLESGTAYIQLQSSSVSIYNTLTIDTGKTAVLDLNGSSILAENWPMPIVTVDGTLTLTDTSSDDVADQGSLLGLASDDAIGVYVRDGGDFTMEAGTITNRNPNNKGRGVKVVNGTFTMTGGSITGNTVTGVAGGGVWVENGIFNLSGGSISENTAGAGGGGVVLWGSTFIMTGGSITNNSTNMAAAKADGGGVQNNWSTFVMTGGEISGNNAGTGGGGVTGDGFTVGGTARITGNTSGDSAIVDNVWLNANDSSKILTVSSKTPLESGASFGISMDRLTPITTEKPANITGVNTADVSAYFFSDKDAYAIQNGTGNVVQLVTAPSYEAAWGMAKVDGSAPDSWVSTGTLVDAVAYANRLESSTAYIRLFGDADTSEALFFQPNKTAVLDLNGHTIDAKQGAFSVLSVSGALTLHDTSAGGTGKITGGNTPYTGGGVLVRNGGNLTMTGGTITGNAATYDGGGVDLQSNASFTMTGGAITGNTAAAGGGVFAKPNSVFTMTGGEISDNTATMGVGGIYVEGVYGESAAAQVTVGGTARITGNQASSGDNAIVSNVQLAPTAILTVSSSVPLAEGASISVRKSIASGATTADITGTNSSDVSGYFASDSDTRSIQNGTGNIVQLVAAPTYEAQWREQNDSTWTSGTLAEAVSFANTLPENYNKIALIKLLSDVTTTQTLEFAERNTTTELDLNGKTIDANGGAFPVLTVHQKFILSDSSTTDVTKQGKITGSNNAGDGGGISLSVLRASYAPVFIMKGGNITGNTAQDGGGIDVRGGYEFTLNGGNISDNTALRNGGGLFLNNLKSTMNAGTISDNTAQNGGGAYMYFNNFAMHGGTISGNTASVSGGGVYFDYYMGSFTMDNGDITGNTTGINGGGLTLVGYSFIGGTANISGNHKTADAATTDNNLYLVFGEPLHIYPEPQEGFAVGVNLQQKPTSSAPRSVTTTRYVYDTDISGYFSSDDSAYETRYNDKEKVVELIVGAEARWGEAKADGSDPDSGWIRGSFTEAAAYANAMESGKTAYIQILNDVTGNQNFKENKTTILDLNGKTITGVSNWNTSVLTVYGNLTLIDTSTNVVANQGRIIGRSCGIAASSGNVTMKGGQITGVNSSFGRGVFVGQTDYISPRGSFTMEGGAITNNTISGLYSKGGGVYVEYGTFIMTGGAITNNTASGMNSEGGGVYVENGTFTMTGGTISGNTANTGGGGVSLGQRGWMKVGGTANISDNNRTAGTPSPSIDNVYLNFESAILVSTDTPLADGASISVSVSAYSKPTANKPFKITSANASNVSNYFHSDDSNYSIKNGTDNVVQLGLGSSTSGPPAITTTSLSNGVVGTAYGQTLEARGQTAITWSVSSGSLPAGLSLNTSTGAITGTPTTAGTSSFTVKAQNSLGSATKAFEIAVTSPITSVSVNPATTTVKKTKTQQFSANVTGTGATTVTWSASGGTKSSISASGLLTVGAAETATTLTVKATSTVDSNKFGTATVTVAAAPKICTVTFNSDGGTPASTSTGGIEEGGTTALPNVPTRENYRFDGWYTAKNGGGTQFTTMTPVSSNITVYAKWTKLVTVSGVVVNDNDTPIAGASVTLLPTYGTTAATTDAEGRFSFARIPEDRFTVKATFDDASTVTVNVTSDYGNVKIVKPKPTITITTQPQDATLVKGIAGQSAVFKIEGTRTPHIADQVGYMWYWLTGTTPDTTKDEAMTGRGSRMTLNQDNGNIPDRGTYKLYGYAYDADAGLEAYSRIATLKVAGTSTIEGVVKKADSSLVSGATVKLAYAGGAWPYGDIAITSSEVTQTTAADGAYKFELVPDGEYKIIITLPGGGEITYGPYDFPGPKPGPVPIDPDIVIPDKAEIRVNGQPQDATVKSGTAVTLTVGASATDSTALAYQWYKSTKNSTVSGEAITGATANTYTPSTADKGTAYYYCVVSGGTLTPVTTRVAKVTVFVYGTIAGTVQTTSKQPIAGAKVELINIDTPVLTGFTTSTNPQTTLADGKYKFIEVPDGTYKLKITLPGTDSPVFVVEPINAPNVNPDIPAIPPERPMISITKQPASKIVALNDTAEFTVNAGVSNDGVVLYQWYSGTTNSTTGGTPIYGATENTYRAPTSTKGVAYYYCVVQATGADNVTSNSAKLTVRNTALNNLMTIEGDVVDENGDKVTGAAVTLSPKAGTSENPQTTKTDGHYKFENLPDGQYTITVKLPGGGVITEEIIINDGEITPTPPYNIEIPTTNSITITQQPKSIEVTTDMTASFTAKATATKAEVTYQWYKNTTASSNGGTKLDGKTTATLELGKQPEGVSYYYCVVSSTGATDAITNAATRTVTKATGGKGDLEGGIVNDENGDPVADATVKLMKNGTDGIQFGATVTTGEDGKFEFKAIPYGSYSLVAQKDTSTVTRQITIKSASTTENLIMPSGAKITRVIIEGDTPSTAVENLEAMFTDADNAIAQQPGAVVEIKLMVKKEDAPSDKGDIDAALTDNQQVGIYLDAKLVKVVSGTVADDGTGHIQPLSGQTLRIVIDLPESLWNKAPYQIIRSHTENGVTDVRIITPDYDRDLQTLSFDADAFSTYAVVYTLTPKYSVTVIGSQAGSSSGTGLYEAGATVTVQAGSKSGYTFDGWTTADGVSFASAGSATTRFTMPAKNVIVTANWKSNGGGGNNSGDDDGDGDSDDPNNNSTPGGGNNSPGGGTSNPSGGNSNPSGGTSNPGGDTNNPGSNSNNDTTGETAPENGSSSSNTAGASDLNDARDNALKQLADERQKAIDALPDSLTDEQRLKALDAIDRIYIEAIKSIQNLDSTGAIGDITEQTVRAFEAVAADAGGEISTQAPVEKEKPFVLLSAVFAAASILGALLAWWRREDEEVDDGNRKRRRIIATVAAVAAILLFMLTTGWRGITFANWWTMAVAVSAAGSLLYALQHHK